MISLNEGTEKRRIPSNDFYPDCSAIRRSRRHVENGFEHQCHGTHEKGAETENAVVGAFPSEQAVLRLVGSILRDINEEWITCKRYLVMNED